MHADRIPKRIPDITREHVLCLRSHIGCLIIVSAAVASANTSCTCVSCVCVHWILSLIRVENDSEGTSGTSSERRKISRVFFSRRKTICSRYLTISSTRQVRSSLLSYSMLSSLFLLSFSHPGRVRSGLFELIRRLSCTINFAASHYLLVTEIF